MGAPVHAYLHSLLEWQWTIAERRKLLLPRAEGARNAIPRRAVAQYFHHRA